MSMTRLIHLRDALLAQADEVASKPPEPLVVTGVEEADRILNDLAHYPHAFVIACVMDRQIRAEKAWLVPYLLSERLGGFDFPLLASTPDSRMMSAMQDHPPLHRFPVVMGKNLIAAVRRIKGAYGGDAATIWSDKPSSATIVRRFLEFEGVGLKIATMAANILVREFRVPVRDRYSIDISTDVHVRRVFSRLGFAPVNASNEHLIYRARELYPEYPGIFDLALWRVENYAYLRPRLVSAAAGHRSVSTRHWLPKAEGGVESGRWRAVFCPMLQDQGGDWRERDLATPVA